jgi:lincosamide nucleotidyltransferase A/C/D/E
VPYLAPDLQLLFKSKDLRPKDGVDAAEVIPSLGGGGLALLRAQLPPDHPWNPLVDRYAPPCTAADAAAVLALIEGNGLACWVDGGWAADALLGTSTRDHRDLDLALPTPHYLRALEVLGDAGFRPVRDDGPYNRVLADDAGVTVDLHGFDPDVVVVDADGVRRHRGAGIPYEAGGFGGRGRIGDRPVHCIDAETLVRYHTGYPVDADDWHDVRLLCERFGLAIPREYDAFARKDGR